MTFQSDSTTVGAWCNLADPHVVLSVLSGAPDWVALDAQHGAFTDSSLRMALLAARRDGGGPPVWIRLADDSPAGIGRALDMGAAGVIVPMVESRAQAARIAAACHYPPRGARSFGPGSLLVGDPVVTMAEGDARVSCSVIIETAAGLDQVESIAGVEGLESLFVGPFDLAASLGVTVDDLLADTAEDAPLARVLAAAHGAGLRARAFAGSIDRARRLSALGFDDVAAFTDTAVIQAGAARAVAEWRA